MVAKFKPEKKTSWQKIFFSILLGVVPLVVMVFLIVSNFRINQKRMELNSRIEELKQEVQATEEEIQALQAQISQSGQESYLEKEARERFNLKKPGEEVVKVLPLEENTTIAPHPEKKWWNPFTW